MIRLRPTRSDLIEVVVLTVIAASVVMGLRSRVLSDTHFAFIAGGYFAYLIWRGVTDWRKRAQRRQVAGLPEHVSHRS